jgi:hypothetical protein
MLETTEVVVPNLSDRSSFINPTSNLTYMVYQLKHRIVELERQLQISKNTKKVTIKHHRIGYDQILKNDKKIKYYTGLPSREVFDSNLSDRSSFINPSLNFISTISSSSLMDSLRDGPNFF